MGGREVMLGREGLVPGEVRSRVPQGPLRDMLLPMEALNGEIEAAERLKRTALRDFGVAPPEDREDPRWDDAPSYRITINPNDAPVPDLYKYALNLIGCPAHGPGEKVLWWVNFAPRRALLAGHAEVRPAPLPPH